jgi:ABC-type bacteriocin/lantibiotic exporter with double-glycine peptidase domain
MDDLLTHWPLMVIPAALYCALIVVGSMKLDATYKSLGGRIASAQDLATMRRAINLNMTLAISLFVFIAIYIVMMFYLAYTGYVKPMTAVIYIPLLTTAGHVCSHFYARNIERRAKNMSVTADDPRVFNTYRLWVKQWEEPRLRLPD